MPTANFIPVVRAYEAGIKINPRGLLACVPGISSYVGGDITAGVLACGMDKTEKLSLLIDIGTNGEIVLGSKDWLIACAARPVRPLKAVGLPAACGHPEARSRKVKIHPKTFEVKLFNLS